MVPKEVPAFVADSLNDILQFAYDTVRMEVRYVIYDVVEQILFDQLRG